jgi:hypothetical protein
MKEKKYIMNIDDVNKLKDYKGLSRTQHLTKEEINQMIIDLHRGNIEDPSIAKILHDFFSFGGDCCERSVEKLEHDTEKLSDSYVRYAGYTPILMKASRYLAYSSGIITNFCFVFKFVTKVLAKMLVKLYDQSLDLK